MGQDQGDRLRMLVVDERHHVLRIDFLQEAERQASIDCWTLSSVSRASLPSAFWTSAWPGPGRHRCR